MRISDWSSYVCSSDLLGRFSATQSAAACHIAPHPLLRAFSYEMLRRIAQVLTPPRLRSRVSRGARVLNNVASQYTCACLLLTVQRGNADEQQLPPTETLAGIMPSIPATEVRTVPAPAYSPVVVLIACLSFPFRLSRSQPSQTPAAGHTAAARRVGKESVS